MDPLRFDSLARRLAGGTSRRQVLKGLVAGVLGAATAPIAASAAPSGKGACAQFCAQLFGPGPAASQCISAAAHGTGPCYQCGPAAPANHPPLCGTTCCASGQVCDAGSCCTPATCQPGQCGSVSDGCDGTLDCGNCGVGQVCVSNTCQTATPPSCPPGSQCESQCQNTTNPFCVCGTTVDGAVPVCYLDVNGCAGHLCSTSTDCSDIGPSSTCISGFCTANLCSTAADCPAGSACVNLNGGCGGCDLFTGGTQGICNPICTS